MVPLISCTKIESGFGMEGKKYELMHSSGKIIAVPSDITRQATQTNICSSMYRNEIAPLNFSML